MSASYAEAKLMVGNDVQLSEAAEPHGTAASTESHPRLPLLVVMAKGHAGALPEAWRSYALIEDARADASEALRNPHVLRVAILEDGFGFVGSVNALRFIEWAG